MQKQRKLCIFRKRFDFICQVFCLVVAGSPFETVHRNGPLFDIAQTYPRKPSCFHRYTHSNGSDWELLFTISPVGFTSPLLWSTGQYIHKGHICDNCLICTTRVCEGSCWLRRTSVTCARQMTLEDSLRFLTSICLTKWKPFPDENGSEMLTCTFDFA